MSGLPVTFNVEFDVGTLQAIVSDVAEAKVADIIAALPDQPLPGGSGPRNDALFETAAIIGPLAGTGVSGAWSETPIAVTITPSAADKRMLITANMKVGATQLSIVQIAIRRTVGGVHTLLVPAGATCNDMARVGDTDQFLGINVLKEDAPGTTEPVTYRVMWRCVNSSAYIGRRGYSTDYVIPSTLYVVER